MEAVRCLLAHGAECTANDDGQTPLHFASQEGQLPVVDLLLQSASGQALVRQQCRQGGWEQELASLWWHPSDCPARLVLLQVNAQDANGKAMLSVNLCLAALLRSICLFCCMRCTVCTAAAGLHAVGSLGVSAWQPSAAAHFLLQA